MRIAGQNCRKTDGENCPFAIIAKWKMVADICWFRQKIAKNFGSKVLISVTQGITYYKNGVIIFTGQEKVGCPDCGGDLRVRSTCHRKLRTAQGIEVYRLRVMGCLGCGKTHRELPNWMVPYKRMDASCLVSIAQAPQKEHLRQASTNTWLRVKRWMAWFLQYAQKVISSQNIQPGTWPSAPQRERFCHLVRLLVNRGRWPQHRFEQFHTCKVAILGAF